ncbi:tRNA (cytidine(34)-2'-O)-methyltransferase [Actinomyces sp. zg-332]|uniref:tRNA (cytidine(34)-2'-O)-methyltransferase n=1 Tax=Actinomyces sp. zg-332 TaxID=2708340 RepID=UPI0014239DE8|nr:tRNA (cytidine(34)-2'-O)-methyltransferase [Actinomyces sp. zg-332]QPK93776.1 tRNA (cytidine(34)-2'-O)-methyltransferase [Actinomyces sp. zg-332]
MLHIIFFEPEIPGNSGNAIRLSACTNSMLHLVEPLSFDMDSAKVKRAGLDYHDMAHVKVHPNLEDALNDISGNIYAFTGHSNEFFTDVKYKDGDGLLFGRESNGLPEEVLNNPRIAKKLRIPMMPNNRSLNLAVSASIAVYEAWRQMGFCDAV